MEALSAAALKIVNTEAADAFCARVPAEKIPEIVAAITGDAAAVRAAQAEAIPDANLPASKNAPGPAAS